LILIVDGGSPAALTFDLIIIIIMVIFMNCNQWAISFQ